MSALIKPLQRKLDHAALKRRRQEIEERLSVFGLARGPRRLSPDARERELEEESRLRRLCEALSTLGPVFSAFGHYLASRVDLLTPQECLELAAISDEVEATPASLVRELIEQELGCALSEAFVQFEDQPFESRLLFQSHRAWLSYGEAVTVRIAHPDWEKHAAYDMELLPLLQSAFAGGGREVKLDSAIADFRATLQRQDFLREAEVMRDLAHDAQEFGRLRVPAVYGSRSTTKVLTIERLPGFNLEQAFSTSARWTPKDGLIGQATDFDPLQLAHTLCLVWLRQALAGRAFPVEPRAADITVLGGGQIAFVGGAYSSLPAEAKKNLWLYLMAAATEEPDRAYASLLREGDNRLLRENELLHRFRQVVPFRDGGWSLDGSNTSLAEHLFVHWRVADEHGFRPRPHLLHFYRGLFQITAAAERLAPGCDPLLSALEDLRFLTGMSQFKEMASWGQLGQSAENHFAMMMGLPQKLDQLLTLASEESEEPLGLRQTESTQRRRHGHRVSVVITLLAVLAAITVFSHYIGGAVVGQWGERLSAIIFVLCGALLLRAADRTG